MRAFADVRQAAKRRVTTFFAALLYFPIYRPRKIEFQFEFIFVVVNIAITTTPNSVKLIILSRAQQKEVT